MPDELDGLLKAGRSIAIPLGDEVERVVTRLTELGLLRAEPYAEVRCVHPLDPDQLHLKDRCCGGSCVVDPGLDEDDDSFRCSDCGRVLRPSNKEHFERVALTPSLDRLTDWVGQAIGDSSVASPGLWRVSAPGGEVEVCLVDVCADRSLLRPYYPRADRLVFVVGNSLDFGRHLPAGRRVFRVVDLVETGPSALRRKIRQLGQLRGGPAVVCEPSGLPPASLPTPTSPFPGVSMWRADRGSRWNQVTIYQVDGLTVQLRVPGRSPRSFSAAELGMVRRSTRTQDTTRKWAILVALCEGHGSCGWRGLAPNFTAFKAQVKQLRPLLQHIIGVDDDPFMACTSAGGLRAAFVAAPFPEDKPYVGEDRW